MGWKLAVDGLRDRSSKQGTVAYHAAARRSAWPAVRGLNQRGFGMETNHQLLCLNMIVKNEAPVIARCLASARPIIDHWVIVDTGSTDGTQDLIRTLMADLPGELHERPWRDFAHNRNEALDLARSHGKYVLIIDAYDVLEFEPKFKMPALQADSYMLRIVDPSFSYNRTQVVRTTLPWRWRGVLHEFLTCDDACSSGVLERLRLRRTHDGARRRDPQTLRQNTEILHAALETEEDPSMQSRYQFYLAQSYRDCGEYEKALQAYLKRAELGFCGDEVYMSLYSAAKLKEALQRPFDEVVATYQRAANAAPSRAEALHGASRYCRLSSRYKEGYEIAKRVVTKWADPSGQAPDGLFVETWIYDYGLLDEFALNAYWAGAYQDSLDACERILRERKCPETEHPRIEANAAFARQQLGPPLVVTENRHEKRIFPRSHSAWPLVVSFYGDGEQWLGHALVDFFDSVALTGPRSELCRIMTEEKSDKGSGPHNYTLFYHFLFRHRRYEITSVFELGLGTNFCDVPSNMGEGGTPGASLRGWRRYFPRAKIFGADIDTRILFSEERISTFYVDQLSDNAIGNLWRKLPYECFDIIIDDGLHSFEANTTFFRGSLQKLKPNGYYIIEDIYTAPDNLNKYHEFFSRRSETGVIIKIPHYLYNYNNCLGIFRVPDRGSRDPAPLGGMGSQQ